MKARTEEVQRWLRFSAACPLGITLMPASEPNSYPPLLDSIMQSSRRWQQFEFGCSLSPESDALTRLLSLSPDDLCMLRDPYILFNSQPILARSVVSEWSFDRPRITQYLHCRYTPTKHVSCKHSAKQENFNHLFIRSPILLRLSTFDIELL